MLHLVAASLAATGASDHWAVLVAGSNTYANYRHQADVCHAYQTLLKKGVPAENIITMAYDDIANDSQNPFPGQIFNKPTEDGTPGADVYAGCKLDYTGAAVTPKNFVKVLTGGDSIDSVEDLQDKTCNRFSNGTKVTCPTTGSCCCTKPKFLFGCDEWSCCGATEQCMPAEKGNTCKKVESGKVLKSTNTSKVFVNFVDHGGVGIIAFPGSAPLMHSTELVAALQKMHDKGMYKELVFYMEACESGSMFQDLPADISIYATTAANAKESSWGTYCPPKDKVNGKSLNTCLGDLYSVKWMEDSDLNLAGETLEAQFQKMIKQVNKSHPLEFGDKQIASEPLVNFQGDASRRAPLPLAAPAAAYAPSEESNVESRSIELQHALATFLKSDSEADAAALMHLVQDRVDSAKRFGAISRAVAGEDVSTRPLPSPIDMQCHYAGHAAYVSACAGWTVGAMKHSATLAKLCAHTAGDAKPIVAAIRNACPAK